MIVVIDGPSGSGKSSTAREVAARSGLYFLDSGAFYRCYTLAFITSGEDMDVFLNQIDTHIIEADYLNNEFRIRLDGQDVSKEIRDRRVSDGVSQVATHPQVRARVNALLRDIAGRYDIVADGRDLGTAVFPDANLKFYMMADLKTRAGRRKAQLHRMGLPGNLEEIHRNLAERDHIDSNRDADPLRQAEDAVVIDTSLTSFNEQVETILGKIAELKN